MGDESDLHAARVLLDLSPQRRFLEGISAVDAGNEDYRLFPFSTGDAAANILAGIGLSPEANQRRSLLLPFRLLLVSRQAFLQDAMRLRIWQV